MPESLVARDERNAGSQMTRLFSTWQSCGRGLLVCFCAVLTGGGQCGNKLLFYGGAAAVPDESCRNTLFYELGESVFYLFKGSVFCRLFTGITAYNIPALAVYLDCSY